MDYQDIDALERASRDFQSAWGNLSPSGLRELAEAFRSGAKRGSTSPFPLSGSRRPLIPHENLSRARQITGFLLNPDKEDMENFGFSVALCQRWAKPWSIDPANPESDEDLLKREFQLGQNDIRALRVIYRMASDIENSNIPPAKAPAKVFAMQRGIEAPIPQEHPLPWPQAV